MSGVLWAGATWLVLLSVWAWRDGRARRQRDWLNKESIALMLVLLGTKSIAAKTSAEELLRDPVVLERAIRGGLAAMSVLIAGPVLVRRLRRPPPFQGYLGMTVLTAYLGIAALTVFYSAAPLVTAAKAFEMGAGLMAVGAAALAHDGRRRLRSMVTFVIALEGALLATAVAGFFLIPESFSTANPFRPGFVSASTMTSPYAHSNYLSAMGALVAVYALARSLQAESNRQRAFGLAGFVFGIVGVLLASGRQGVIILVAAVFFLLWFQRRTLFLTLIGPASIAILWISWESAFRIFARGRPQLITNLTGRVPWWESALEAWALHPWTGYGYGAGGRFVALANVGRSQVSNVHSGYVETLVGVGLIGAIPLVIAIGLVLSWSLRALRDGRDVPMAVLIVPLLLHTAVSQGVGGWLNADFILLAALAGLADWWRRARASPKLEEEAALR